MCQVSHTHIHTYTKGGEVYRRSQLSLFMDKIEGNQTRVLTDLTRTNMSAMVRGHVHFLTVFYCLQLPCQSAAVLTVCSSLEGLQLS